MHDLMTIYEYLSSLGDKYNSSVVFLFSYNVFVVHLINVIVTFLWFE